jgi:hypothetical protein
MMHLLFSVVSPGVVTRPWADGDAIHPTFALLGQKASSRVSVDHDFLLGEMAGLGLHA